MATTQPTKLKPALIAVCNDIILNIARERGGDEWINHYYELISITPASRQRLLRVIDSVEWSYREYPSQHQFDFDEVLFIHPPQPVLVEFARYLSDTMDKLQDDDEEDAE